MYLNNKLIKPGKTQLDIINCYNLFEVFVKIVIYSRHQGQAFWM